MTTKCTPDRNGIDIEKQPEMNKKKCDISEKTTATENRFVV